MGKESFILYDYYSEQIQSLSDEQAGVLLKAIFAYRQGVSLPEMDGVAKIAFSFICSQIDRDQERYEKICKTNRENGILGAEYGKKGGRPRKTPNGDIKTPKNPERGAKNPLYDNEYENDITPPLYSPPKVGENTKKEIFCEKYPKYRKSIMESNVSDIDFGLLISEFEKSTYLQKMYTFKQVLEVYPSIIKGEFRDGKTSDVDERNARVERERFYAERKQRSMSVAEKYLQLARKSSRFKTIASELAKLEIAIAKAEMYAPSVIEDVKAQKAALIKEQEGILNTLGIQKEWLNPQPYCKKCSDTGFLRNGKACDCYDCYKKEKK